MNPRLKFYEIVRVNSDDADLAEINGERGAMLGMTEEDAGEFNYAVYVYRDEICCNIAEHALEPTDEFSTRDTFYDGSSLRAGLDGRGGEWIDE